MVLNHVAKLADLVVVRPAILNANNLGDVAAFVSIHCNSASSTSATGWEIFTSGLYGAWVSSVAVDPQDPDTAYITYSNFGVPHVLRTTNGGQDWFSIDGIDFEGVPDIPAHWVAVRPCNSRQLFVGTELGVFASDDGGASWAPFNTGLAHTVVETLDWKNENTLVAFTHGRGVSGRLIT